MTSPLLLALTLAAATAPAGPPAVEIPKDKEHLHLDLMPGAMGPVEFKHADHAGTRKQAGDQPLTCRDCHHDLATDRPATLAAIKGCRDCHVDAGKPEKTVGGKLAPAMARLKPNGALDNRYVLLHDYCRGCHKRSSNGERQLANCKVCHPRGITQAAIKGPGAAVEEPPAAAPAPTK